MTAIVSGAERAPRQRQVRPSAATRTNPAPRTTTATRTGTANRGSATRPLAKGPTAGIPTNTIPTNTITPNTVPATTRIPRPARTVEAQPPAAAPPQVRGVAGPAGVDGSALSLLNRLAEARDNERERVRLRERVIEAWLPLARHLALRFHGRGEPLDDLVQTATIGLIKAIDRFDPAVGGDFVAYAVPTIVGEIKRYFRDRTWDLRVPRRVQELKLDIASATTTLAQRLGRSPTVSDLASHLNRGEEEIIEGLDAARAYSAVSLSTLVGGEQGTELSDLCGFEDTELAMAEVRATLGPALAQLSEREQKIIILRFFGNLTQTQIAERVGISQMHVSRLLARSLATLRTHLEPA